MPQQTRLLSKAEIVQRLQLVSRYSGLTMAALATLCNRSRQAMYDAKRGRISDELQQILSKALQESQYGDGFRNPAQGNYWDRFPSAAPQQVHRSNAVRK